MMILDRNTRSIIHSKFAHFPDILEKDSILVINNSKVIPARLMGKRKSGRKIEILSIRETAFDTWECKVKNSSRTKIGESLELCEDHLKAELLEKKASGECLLKFHYSGKFYQLLEKYGFAPVPPYIHKARTEKTERTEDLKQYQTVYAEQYGAIAAPTAGLHFSNDILQKIREKGVKIVELTLHVGLGTFEPIRVDDITEHKMHTEYYHISQEAAQKITDAKQLGGKIVSVGTTSARALEAAWTVDGIRSGEHSTDIFIYPSYQFSVVDQLLTNFHLPESTLLMLVSALSDKESILKAYQQAIEKRYRFYSYGDCMFLR